MSEVLTGPSTVLRSSLVRLKASCPNYGRVTAIQELVLMDIYAQFPCYSFPLKHVLFKRDFVANVRQCLKYQTLFFIASDRIVCRDNIGSGK